MGRRMTDSEKSGDLVTLCLREGFPDFDWIERPDPGASETEISGGEDDVGTDDCGVGLRPVAAVTRASPGLGGNEAPISHTQGGVVCQEKDSPPRSFML